MQREDGRSGAAQYWDGPEIKLSISQNNLIRALYNIKSIWHLVWHGWIFNGSFRSRFGKIPNFCYTTISIHIHLQFSFSLSFVSIGWTLPLYHDKTGCLQNQSVHHIIPFYNIQWHLTPNVHSSLMWRNIWIHIHYEQGFMRFTRIISINCTWYSRQPVSPPHSTSRLLLLFCNNSSLVAVWDVPAPPRTTLLSSPASSHHTSPHCQHRVSSLGWLPSHHVTKTTVSQVWHLLTCVLIFQSHCSLLTLWLHLKQSTAEKRVGNIWRLTSCVVVCPGRLWCRDWSLWLSVPQCWAGLGTAAVH